MISLDCERKDTERLGTKINPGIVAVQFKNSSQQLFQDFQYLLLEFFSEYQEQADWKTGIEFN